MTKITVSNAKKIALKFFRSEMTPPPPLREFSGNSSVFVETGFPNIHIYKTSKWKISSFAMEKSNLIGFTTQRGVPTLVTLTELVLSKEQDKESFRIYLRKNLTKWFSYQPRKFTGTS